MSQEATDTGRVRVVGTAHVSAESAEKVQSVIETEQPDVVAVELDEGRYRQLRGDEPDDLAAADLLRGNTVFQFLAYWMLSYVQTRLGDRFDVQPGADMLAAIDAADAIGTDIALVDRDINETMRRFWNRMTRIEKIQLIGGLAVGAGNGLGIGLAMGVIAGIFFGPLIALFGNTIGITSTLLTRVAGGALLALATAVVIWIGTATVLSTENRLLSAVGGGIAVGGIAGFGLGIAEPITAQLGPLTVRVLGSVTLGLTAGIISGTLLGELTDVFRTQQPEENIEEFDMTEMTDTDVVSAMMAEFRQFSPGGAEALIDERDAYIANRLVELRDQGQTVVAVVGAGHREGIERYLKHPDTLPPQESLTGTQSGRIPWSKLVGGGVSAVGIGCFVLLALSSAGNQTLWRLFGAWFLINGIFAAGLAKAAGAHWSSSLVGGAIAWLTSINPFLAPGWFTGYVELQHDPVNVSDISTLNELLSDEERPLGALITELLEVPLFRLIIVVAATNIGSIVASTIFVAYLLPLFALDLGGVSGVVNLLIEGARNGWQIIWTNIT